MLIGRFGERGRGGGGVAVRAHELARLHAAAELDERIDLQQRMVDEMMRDGLDFPGIEDCVIDHNARIHIALQESLVGIMRP